MNRNEPIEDRTKLVENNETGVIPVGTPMPDCRRAKWRLPDAERPPRGTTLLPCGGKMIYNGDLTVLDKDGDVVSWMPSELLAMLWGDDLEDEEEEGGVPPGETVSDGKEREEFPKEHKEQA